MFEFFSLANVRVLLELNHWLAQNPSLYRLALFLTDELADILTLATLALLWFWPEPKREALLPRLTLAREKDKARGPSGRGKIGRDETAPRGLISRLKVLFTRGEVWLTREESRAQLLVFGVAGMTGYVTARLIALQMNIDRPFVTYLPVRAGVPGAFEDLRVFGSFPSDHAVLLAALPTALFFWNRRLAWLWVGLGAFLALVRVAVGFHYPSDMLGGALLGFVLAWAALRWYRAEGRLHEGANALARSFDRSNSPYCYLMYFFLALVGLEFAMHFQHVLDLIYSIRGHILYRLNS